MAERERYTPIEVSGPGGTVEMDACWDCGVVVWHRPTHDFTHDGPESVDQEADRG